VARHPDRWVLLYQDELTYYRRPTLAQGYARRGSKGPVAAQGTGYNTYRRIAGCLNALTGQFTSWQRQKFDRRTFGRYLRAVAAAYPAAERIFVVLDNWTVHHHEEVAAALRGSRIHLVFLPTYSPWLNPTEKVWRKVYQERLHQHEYASAWGSLIASVAGWLEQYAGPSLELLRYTGLLTTDLIC
jgi:putative transposase